MYNVYVYKYTYKCIYTYTYICMYREKAWHGGLCKYHNQEEKQKSTPIVAMAEAMHLYNAWLPPPVAQQTFLETKAFSEAVQRLKKDLAVSPFATLKWISIVNKYSAERLIFTYLPLILN